MLKRSKIALCAALIGLLCIFTYLVWIESQPAAVPFYLEVQVEDRTERYGCWQVENRQYYVVFPSYTDLTKSRIVVNTSDKLSIDGEFLNENTDCSKLQEDYAYELICHGLFVEQKFELMFLRSGEMPVVHIDTESGKMDYIHGQKGNEEKANIRIYSEGGALTCDTALKSIAGRGNSTFGDEKKPYIIKFTEPENVFGMGAANKWILLANAFDLTNLRNYLVLESARKTGLSYTPDAQWVELYLNSEYAGLYMLTEKIEVHDNRVELPDQEGYLFSLEDRGRIITQNLPHYDTKAGLTVRIRYPEVLNETSQATLAALVQRAENAILAENGTDPQSGAAWDELIDTDSWARKYLVEEIFANLDAGKWSQYFYISGDDRKLYAGPVWDYDLSMAISWKTAMTNIWYCSRTAADGSIIAPWFEALSRNPEFMQRVVEIYEKEFLPILQKLIGGGVDQAAQVVARSSAVNALRWGKTAVPEGNVEHIKEHLQERVRFLNGIWLEGTEYVNVTVYLGGTDGYVQMMIPADAPMDMLPEQEGDLLGWRWSADDTPVTPEQVVKPDAQIYAVRGDSPTQQDKQLIKLVPLGVIGLMGLVLVAVEVCRLKSKRWHYCDGNR